MREDNMELLEKAFPNGYVIMHVQPNSDPAIQWYNPKKDEFIYSYLDMLDEVFFEEDL